MEKTYINCKYRERVIIPTLGLSPNTEFFFLNDKEKQGKELLTKDGIVAKVRSCTTKTAFDLEEEIKELYKVSTWEYLSKWNKVCDGLLSSLWLWDMYLEKA